MAKQNTLLDDVTKQKSKAIIDQAKRKGYRISEKISNKRNILSSKLKKSTKSKIRKTVNAGKGLTTSKKEYLELLENLAKLKTAGIITTKEFQEKKKKILSKI
jgi:DNA-binding transcriptional regulator YhcF (GntR family)